MLVVGVLATFFIGPGVAIAFLLVRKARRRSLRRSPIGINLLRSPGHSLRVEIEEVSNDLTWDILSLSVLPLILLALFLAQGHVRGWTQVVHLLPLFVGAAALALAFVIRKMLSRGQRLDRLRAGYDAELAVGQELDTLMRQGAFVYHDFPAGTFNIDHVVVSTSGVFAVETKGYTKSATVRGRESVRVAFDGRGLRFPTWASTEPVEQAERQAKWLAEWLTKAVGKRVSVRAVLALPGWFVDRQQAGVVQVFSGRELARILESPADPPLPESLVRRVSHQLDQKCRTVAPTFDPSREAAAS